MWGICILKLKYYINISQELKNQITKVGAAKVEWYVKTEVIEPYKIAIPQHFMAIPL